MAAVNVPNDFQNNTTADAESVDANFNALTEFINGSVIHVDGSKAMTGELPLVDGGTAASTTYVDNRVPVVSLVGTTAVTGKAVFDYSGFAGGAEQTKLFGTTFTAAPLVLLSVETSNAHHGYKTFAYARNITTTQLDLGLKMEANFSDSPQSFIVHWFALGQVA